MTPNTVGGGGSMMILILVLAVIFKITIEFFLTRWQKKRDAKRDDKSVV
jgi:preprotein translocase subunit YajC